MLARLHTSVARPGAEARSQLTLAFSIVVAVQALGRLLVARVLQGVSFGSPSGTAVAALIELEPHGDHARATIAATITIVVSAPKHTSIRSCRPNAAARSCERAARGAGHHGHYHCGVRRAVGLVGVAYRPGGEVVKVMAILRAPGAVLILECESVPAAADLLNILPLVTNRTVTVELIELQPFQALQMLFGPKSA